MQDNKIIKFFHTLLIGFLIVYSCMVIYNNTYNFLLTIFLYFFISYVLISAGLHRYFTHNSYKLNRIKHYTLSYLCCFALLGSPLSYAAIHLTHHKYSDTKLDPHSPELGILALIFGRFNSHNKYVFPIRLLKDKFNVFLYKYYHLIFLCSVFVFYLINVTFFNSLCIAIATNIITIGLFNYFSHKNMIGNYRNYTTEDNSQNNIIFLILHGDLHNTHHKFPSLRQQKMFWYEIDIVSYIIKLISYENKA